MSNQLTASTYLTANINFIQIGVVGNAVAQNFCTCHITST